MDDRNTRMLGALDAMLGFLCPERQGLAGSLARRYGSAAAVINAGGSSLVREGMTESDALMVSMIPGIVRHIARAKAGEHPFLAGFNEARDYLRTRFLGCAQEMFYLLSLDENGRLIECTRLAGGSEASAPFNIRQILSEVVRLQARSVIMTHNHPDGTRSPSKADIACTLRLMDALRPLNAPLLDHIIMPDRQGLSLRNEKYISTNAFLAQSGSKLLRDYR